MCGIIGYIGHKQVLPLLISGLEKLEYRGYDSAGVCVGSGLEVVKKKGRVAELKRILDGSSFEATIGVGHTRWSTHGEPNDVNAHPHVDCSGTISIVHNGIIENYYSLRSLLIKEGHTFTSVTDSEILAHLIKRFYSGDLVAAVSQALKLVEGTFGLVVQAKDCDYLVAARRGSPLIIGVGVDEMFVASDVTAILEHTKNVVYLEDNEIARVSERTYEVSCIDGASVDKKVHRVQWDIEHIEKKGFKHFMLKEIFEQPESIANTLRGRIKDGRVKLSVDVSDVRRFVITACGTSWHSALIGKYLIENIARIPVEVDYASEFRYRKPLLRDGDVVIAISQSGETADTLAALREAREQGIKTLGIVNVVGSSIAREVNSGIYLHAGPEIGVASTKAFTCQVTSLLLLALYCRQEKGGSLDAELIDSLIHLPTVVNSLLEYSIDIRNIAGQFTNCRNFLYLGRGLNFPVALEGALKLKEISYIHAEGYPAAEMKHGPIALIDEEMPVFFISPQDHTHDKIVSNMEEVRARKGRIISLVNKKDGVISRLADVPLVVPRIREELQPIVHALPLQLFAYHVADLLRIDVDKPRNLAKSVTVE